MPTKIIAIDSHHPQAEQIEEAAGILRRGGLVAFPTETVYGLGADALQETAVQKIFEAKGRPAGNPLIVHIHDVAQTAQLAADWPEAAQRLAEKFWPGSLTLVVTKHACIPDIVTAGGPTVALRLPAHPVALALLRAGVPLAAPSANRSNRLSPTTAEHVRSDLADRIDMILDGGPCSGGLESTVLDVTAARPRLLRPGLVTPAQIEEIIGPIEIPAQHHEEKDTPILRSPGMMKKHYAPQTPLECVQEQSWKRVDELLRQGLRIGWLALPDSGGDDHPHLVKIVLPADAEAYAARMYAALHELDAAGVDRIIVSLPTPSEEWLAVRDRLGRAGAE